MKKTSWLLCILLTLFGCTSVVKTDGNHIVVKANQKFTIEIRGNITTGFEWRQAEEDKEQAVVEFLGRDYKTVKSKPNLCGAPGTFYFHFLAKQPGECTLHFEHLRPWEKEKPPVDKKEYQITVQ